MSLELNKVAAAVLTGGIVAMLSGFVAGKLYHPETLEEPAYKIALPDSGGEKEEAPKKQSILPLIASADVEAGKKQTSKCSACHTFTEGGADGVGPNLWNIVGSEPAHVAGYSFSDALLKLKDEGKNWDYKNLSDFLEDPKGYAPGTKMAFAGLRKIDQRADLIAYLRTLSSSPVPLPPKEEAAKPEDGADEKAEGATDTASVEAPKAEETKAGEEPKAEEAPAAAAEAPKAEDSSTAAAEAPKSEEPKAEEAAEAPKAEESTTAAAEAPKAEETTTAATAEAPKTEETATAAEAPKADETETVSAEAPKAEEAAASEAPKEEAAAAATGAAASGGEPQSELGKLLANADIDQGKKVARKCSACHTFEEGGKNRVGPNLYGIIGKVAGEGDGFKFSKAMAAKGAEGYTWTYEHLDQYLANPREAIPGNKMTFPGLKKPQDRADVIAYIRSLAKDPPPLPN